MMDFNSFIPQSAPKLDAEFVLKVAEAFARFPHGMADDTRVASRSLLEEFRRTGKLNHAKLPEMNGAEALIFTASSVVGDCAFETAHTVNLTTGAVGFSLTIIGCDLGTFAAMLDMASSGLVAVDTEAMKAGWSK